MPDAAAASGVTHPAMSPGICTSNSMSRGVFHRSRTAGSSLHCQVSVSIGHWMSMLFAAVSRKRPVKRRVMYPDDVVKYAVSGFGRTNGS